MDTQKYTNLARSKTIWTGISAIAAAGAAYADSQITGGEAIQITLNGVLGIFLRVAIQTVIDRQ